MAARWISERQTSSSILPMRALETSDFRSYTVMSQLRHCSGFLSGHIVLLVVSTFRTALSNRVWGSVSMDQTEDCHIGVRRPNNDMLEGDVFMIKSDNWNGKPSTSRQPAECLIAFNLGNRVLSVSIKDWSCDNALTEPFLAFYDDCSGERRNLMSFLNCSTVGPFQAISTSGSCMSIYHFRGNLRGGYYFSLKVVAGEEMLAFPAGGIAAIVIAVVVGLLILAKLVCMVTGYEQRLPDTPFNFEEYTKQVLDARLSSTPGTSAAAMATAAGGEPVIQIDIEPTGGNGFAGGISTNHRMSSTASNVQMDGPIITDHQNLLTTAAVRSSSGSPHSNSSPIAEISSNYDYDFLDLPVEILDSTPHRLKRYPSARATSIWRHQ